MWPFDDDKQESLPEWDLAEYQRPEGLAALLEQEDLTPEVNKMARGIDRDLNKVSQAGLDPQLTEPRSNLFWDLLDTLDAPRQGVAGVADTLLRGDMFSQDAKTGKDVGFGWSRGQEEDTTFSDILRRNDIIDNPIARGVVGFAGDLVMDPLTYLTFGTGAAVKIGGKAVTEAGSLLKTQGVQRLIERGITGTVEQDKILDEVFRGISLGQDSLKEFNSTTSDSVRAAFGHKLEQAKDIFSPLFKEDEVLSADIFKRPGLRIGAAVPFLGHLQKADDPIETFIKSATGEVQGPGIVGQSLRLLSKTLKPGRFELANFELSDDAAKAFASVNEYASQKLGALGSGIAALPVVGSALGRTGEAASTFFDNAQELFMKTFNRKGLVGVSNDQLANEYQDAIAGAKTISRTRALEVVGEEGLKNQDDLKDGYLLIDRLGGDAAARIDATGAMSPGQFQAILRRQALGNDVLDGDLAAIREAANTPLSPGGDTPESLFRMELQAAIDAPDIKPEVKLAVTKLMSTFDELALQEADSGIKSGYLEYYVTHRYQNVDRNPFGKPAPGSAAGFTKERKYDTFTDAYKHGGHVADIDIPKLIEWRINKSLTLQAQRTYAHRTMIENSIPENLVKAMYQEAIFEPNGAAAKALKRNRWGFTPKDFDKLAEGSVSVERQKLLGKAIVPGAKLSSEEKALLAGSHEDFSDYVHKTMWSNGVKPKDADMPDMRLGEIGREVAIPGGGKMFLPKPVADAFTETVAARDLLKEKFGGTAAGTAFIKATDHATSFFKKFVTLPFPAYWGQNFMGDRFRQMMGGLHAMDPGAQARTYTLMAGKSSVTNKAGQVLDKPTLDRIIKENGLAFNVSDYLGAIESFGDMNVDRFLRTKKGMLSNFMSREKGAKGAFLTQAHDKMQKSFDGFFRVSEIVRRFEAGDGIPDAIRGANDMYFNYRNMTPVESSYFRRFYMFYGYMSKATRSSFTDLVTNPGNLTSQLHGTRALAEFFSDPDAAPTAEGVDLRLMSSSATAEQISHVVGKSPDGKPIIGRGFGAPLNAVMQQFSIQAPRNFTVSELADTAVSSAKRTIQKQFASANPMINAAAQVVSGKNLYFDKPLSAEFLRKVPSLNAAAERLAGYKHNELPIDLDAATKYFLKAVPDGKGRLIADTSRMWILMNLIPGLSRATSLGGTFTNADVPTKAALLRGMLGVNLQDNDISRTYLHSQREELSRFMSNNSVSQRLKNMDPEEAEEE